MNGLRRLCLLPLLLLFMLLAALLAGLALCPPALAFPDVDPADPYAVAIADLAARGIVSGRLDGSFGPDEPVSRCQFAKMIVNTLGIPHTDRSTPFTDVGPDDLPKFVAAAAVHGITNGTNQAGTLFSPWGQVSRAQVLTMVVRGLDSENYQALRHVFGGIGGWGFFDPTHAEYASTAWGNGLVHGLPPMTSLDPWAPMPRGEVAQVLWNALNLIESFARITEVMDGDTVRADYRGKNETIRLLGIDAPELDEPLGPEAKSRLAGLFGSAGLVRLQFDAVTRDEEGHLLSYVLFDAFPDWWMANWVLLRDGLARLLLVPPNLKWADELRSAEDSAKERHLGIWNPNPDSPLEILSVHPDAAGDDNGNLNDEWIEFRVTMGWSLAGYAIQNQAGQRYDFSADRGHWPGEVFKLCTGSGTDETDLHWGAGSEIWNNVKDTVFVIDPEGRVVAERSW